MYPAHWRLVPIPDIDGHPQKGPQGAASKGWNKPENLITPEQARSFRGNIGLHHGASGTCAIDIDNVEKAKVSFATLGLDLDELLGGGIGIRSRPGRAKALFRAPGDLKMRSLALDGTSVFEFRAGPVQDVIPPSRHPEGGHYEWIDDPDLSKMPVLPRELIAIWREWERFAPQLDPSYQQPTAPIRTHRGGESVISRFNAKHPLREFLIEHGYKPKTERRLLSPNSTTGLAGVYLFDDDTAYTHHASDGPLANGHRFNSFDVFMVLDCNGNFRDALARAKNILGPSQKAPSQEIDLSFLMNGKPEPSPSENMPEILKKIQEYCMKISPYPDPDIAAVAAISIASVVCGRYYCSNYISPNYTALYHIVIVDSGGGKEIIRRAAEKIFIQAHEKSQDFFEKQGIMPEIPDKSGIMSLLGRSNYTGESAVHSALVEEPAHLTFQDEFGIVLKAANAPGSGSMKMAQKAIMEVFGMLDGVFRPRQFAMQSLRAKEKEEIKKYVVRPSLTLVGLTTPDSFFDALSGADIAEGFLNRLIVVQSEVGFQRAKDEYEDVEIPSEIIEWVIRTYGKGREQKEGDGNLQKNEYDTPVSPIVKDFTKDAIQVLYDFEGRIIEFRKQEKEQKTRLDPMPARWKEQAMRLSVILAVAKDEPKISGESTAWAVSWVEYHGKRMIQSLRDRISETEDEKVINEFLRILKEVEEISWRAIQRKAPLSKYPSDTARRYLDTLTARGLATTYEKKPERGPSSEWIRILDEK